MHWISKIQIWVTVFYLVNLLARYHVATEYRNTSALEEAIPPRVYYLPLTVKWSSKDSCFVTLEERRGRAS